MKTFLDRRLTVLILCLDSTMLMWLKISPTKGKKATNTGPFLGASSLASGLTA